MKHPEHICRFNDAPQTCECYYAGRTEERSQIVKLIDVEREKLQTEAEWLDTRLLKNDWDEPKFAEAMAALNVKNITNIMARIDLNHGKAATLTTILNALNSK